MQKNTTYLQIRIIMGRFVSNNLQRFVSNNLQFVLFLSPQTVS